MVVVDVQAVKHDNSKLTPLSMAQSFEMTREPQRVPIDRAQGVTSESVVSAGGGRQRPPERFFIYFTPKLSNLGLKSVLKQLNTLFLT